MKRKKINLLIKNIYYRLILLILVSAMFLSTAANQAEAGGIDNPLIEIDSFPELIKEILEKIVVPIGAVIAALAIVYSGFLFVTAQGNAEKLSKARSAFVWAVIGGLILLGSWAISEGIQATLDPIIGP
jgi:hypothetical protein